MSLKNVPEECQLDESEERGSETKKGTEESAQDIAHRILFDIQGSEEENHILLRSAIDSLKEFQQKYRQLKELEELEALAPHPGELSN